MKLKNRVRIYVPKFCYLILEFSSYFDTCLNFIEQFRACFTSFYSCTKLYEILTLKAKDTELLKR